MCYCVIKEGMNEDWIPAVGENGDPVSLLLVDSQPPEASVARGDRQSFSLLRDLVPCRLPGWHSSSWLHHQGNQVSADVIAVLGVIRARHSCHSAT